MTIRTIIDSVTVIRRRPGGPVGGSGTHNDANKRRLNLLMMRQPGTSATSNAQPRAGGRGRSGGADGPSGRGVETSVAGRPRCRWIVRARARESGAERTGRSTVRRRTRLGVVTVSQQGSGASKVVLEILAAVVVALAVGGTSPWWWDKVAGDGDADGSEKVVAQESPTNDEGAGAPDSGAASAGEEGGASTDDGVVTPAGDASCIIMIENPLVSINEEPDHTSREVGGVPVGSYAVSDQAETTFAGRDELWFEITADGRMGWVLDSTILIRSKSSACP